MYGITGVYKACPKYPDMHSIMHACTDKIILILGYSYVYTHLQNIVRYFNTFIYYYSPIC